MSLIFHLAQIQVLCESKLQEYKVPNVFAMFSVQRGLAS